MYDTELAKQLGIATTQLPAPVLPPLTNIAYYAWQPPEWEAQS